MYVFRYLGRYTRKSQKDQLKKKNIWQFTKNNLHHVSGYTIHKSVCFLKESKDGVAKSQQGTLCTLKVNQYLAKRYKSFR